MPYAARTLAAFKGDPTNATSALNWLRFILRDTSSNEPQNSDDELNALLTADIMTINSTAYYRPHVTAANYILSDWTRGESESNRLGSITWRQAKVMANGITSSYSWFDDAIDAHLLAAGSQETVASSLPRGSNELQLVI